MYNMMYVRDLFSAPGTLPQNLAIRDLTEVGNCVSLLIKHPEIIPELQELCNKHTTNPIYLTVYVKEPEKIGRVAKGEVANLLQEPHTITVQHHLYEVIRYSSAPQEYEIGVTIIID